jgi:hypothetical protein
MTDQHPDQFKTYSELPHERKKEYFPDEGSSPSRPDSALNSPAAPSISARFFRRPIAIDTSLNIFVDECIVEGIIGDLLFDPDAFSIALDGGTRATHLI